MRVVIQQADMDTILTALILGVDVGDEIAVVRGDASRTDLEDPAVCCIEAGGSGEVERRNFDHHDTSRPLPPACRQAFETTGRGDPGLAHLVDYVAAIDVGDTSIFERPVSFPRLSDLVSGMRLSLSDPRAQLLAGIGIFRTVLREGIDPFGTMPERPEWRSWIEARRQENERLARERGRAEIFKTDREHTAGFLETDTIGAIGTLYALGCEIAIGFAPHFGTPPVPKYTIAGKGIRVDHLLPLLNALEPGWGGPAHGTIIASPRTGSRLPPDKVKEIVRTSA
ncbi:MAG: hypothetical protein D6795_03570 [Deltaproteobacteria bacterium]|nr:MAG: hypothetical protein D6795_03570 [Deltaproteobacteria bacterium]